MTGAEQQELFAAAVREHVRALSDSDFRTFLAETRPPGEAGRAAAQERFATAKPETAGAAPHAGPGAAGRAAAQERFTRNRFPSTHEKDD